MTVTDDGEGQLLATKEYTNGPAVFTNTYTPNPDSIVIEASKILRGQSLRGGQFTFELVDTEGNVIASATNNRNGQIIFDEISYTEAGEYRYILREVQGSQRRMTYDGREYEILVTVTDDGVGTLTAELEYLDVDEVVFENRYRPSRPVGPGPEDPGDPRDPDPEDPTDPEVPTDPTDPEDPIDPEEPEQPEPYYPGRPITPEEYEKLYGPTPEGAPDRPITPEEYEKLYGEIPGGGIEVPEKGDTLPQTGILWWPVQLLALAGITIFGIGLASNKKEKRKNNE